MADDYITDERILEACPSCDSGHLTCVVGTELDCCLDCYRVWERLPADEPYTCDGEQMPFKTPCATCAFRGNSPEREAEGGEYWKDLQQNLSLGGEFYCHAGVPFKVPDPFGQGLRGGITHEFEYPRKSSTVDLAGETKAYQHYDKDRMRLCRGYLNAHIGPLLKKVLTHA